MNTKETTSEVDLEDVPWTSWIIAGCLTIVIAVVVARIWLMWNDAANRELSLQLVLVAVLVVGFGLFATKQAHSCVIDRPSKTMTISRGGLLDSTSVKLRFEDIATCYKEHWQQADGVVYRLSIRLRTGESLPISNWKRKEDVIDQMCQQLRRAVRSI